MQWKKQRAPILQMRFSIYWWGFGVPRGPHFYGGHQNFQYVQTDRNATLLAYTKASVNVSYLD